MAIRALVMGFGGTGAHILTYVKEQAVLKYGAKSDSVRFLLFDTIADWQPGATVRIAGGAGEETTAKGSETSLDPDREYFFLADRDPDLRQYVYELLAPGGSPERHSHLKDWLHTAWLRDNVERAQMEIVVGAAQQRQIGRFAMFQNAQKIYEQIGVEVRELARASQGGPVSVWIVGSSAGGTGAGCLLDAAHLTRLAVGSNRVSVTGVIVLPEVYHDKAGVSQGRAYSLFRELDRFQRQGIPDRDRYLLKDRLAASTVLYDPSEALRSIVPNKLFDNVFYVGSICQSEDARTGFFTSVASAIDPFLDEYAGPLLLEKSVNVDAAASAFGAARLYVPKETLGELFAWQQVELYLRHACAFVEEQGHRRLTSGSAQERRQAAVKRVEALSPLFSKTLELEGVDEALRKFARTLQPTQIVEEWYGLASPQLIGLSVGPEEVQDLRLTYAAPAYSWKESDPARVAVPARTIKTRSEYRAARVELGLPAESADASRDRFARELEAVMRAYKDAEGSERSFARGRRLLRSKLGQHLRHKVDTLVIEAIAQSSRFGLDEAASEQGTPLTRLHQELKEMVADDGPLLRIEHRVRLFIEALRGEEEQREHEAVQAIQDLREWRPRLFGGSVDAPQAAARDAVSEYFTVYQRDRLLEDLLALVREVRARTEEWERRIRAAFDAMVSDPTKSSRAIAAGHIRRLESRLARLARNPNARISADPDWGPGRTGEDMLGFRQALADRCTLDADRQPLAAAVLRASTWHLEVDERQGGSPSLELRRTVQGGLGGHSDLTQLHRPLYDGFRAVINRELEAVDIFDYLAWAERERGITASQLARALNEAAAPLINSQGRETCHLVVRTPNDTNKERWIHSLAESLRSAIGNTGELERVAHSDRDSISVFRILKPRNLDDIRNVVDCRTAYISQQGQDPAVIGDELRKELKRAQVYHPFRPELEAWFIERRARQLSQTNFDDRNLLSPRLTALLEDPAMMQAFTACVATGAVEKVDGDWIWHAEGEDIPLTVDGADDDLIRAAVVFVLQRREGRDQGLRRISLGAAQKSAIQRAQAATISVADAWKKFLPDGLETLLQGVRYADHGDLERDRQGLRMLFDFYGKRTTRSDLGRRLELVHSRTGE